MRGRARDETSPVCRQQYSSIRRVGLLLSAASIAASCGGDSAPIFVDDVVEPATTTTTIVIVPATTEGPLPTLDPVTVTRAWSPGPGIAEIIGTGALLTDAISVDGLPESADSFILDENGGFTMRVLTGFEGSHDVCIRDVCMRIFTLASDVEAST